MVDYVVSLIITIIGGVTCHYVIKWLDSRWVIGQKVCVANPNKLANL